MTMPGIEVQRVIDLIYIHECRHLNFVIVLNELQDSTLIILGTLLLLHLSASLFASF